MRRRRFLAGLLTAAVARAAAAEDRAKPIVGFLDIEVQGASPGFDAFMDGMRELGHVDGGDVLIDARFVGYRMGELKATAAALAAKKPAVIVAYQPVLDAARATAGDTPIVTRMTLDPVASEVVGSLARPGGNVTGVSSYSSSLYSKRIEIAKELAPGMERVGVLHVGSSQSTLTEVARAEEAARALGLAAVRLTVNGAGGLAAAFDAADKAGIAAVIPIRSIAIVSSRAEVARLAAAHRLPAVYDDRQFCEAGGLVSYGANLTVLHKRTAYYVDRILKGAKPADLPIEEPTVFELVVNAGAAKALGLDMPPTLLVRADQIID
ncbi:MAG TPA: ABC transporter substrate-binding protein [Stellaceae bacterium]|nr:ABC transporter substrate-binding protein [Stellaceae bacterium]